MYRQRARPRRLVDKTDVRALSIRQPFAELILRGIKTVEYRSRPTRIIGEPFLIYASKAPGQKPGGAGPRVWSRDLAGGQPPAWLIELAEQVRMIEPEFERLTLPTGVIVGTAVIERSVPLAGPGPAVPHYAWHLTGVERARQLRKPTRMPQPVWFSPF